MNALKRLDNSYPSTLRNDLFDPFESVFNEFFSDFFRGSNTLNKIRSVGGNPKMNVVREGDQLVLRASVPGVKQEDLKVEMIDDNTVEITGKIAEEYQSSSNEQFFIRELSQRSFSRRLSLGDNFGDPEASLKDGILTLRWNLPREPVPERKYIEIK